MADNNNTLSNLVDFGAPDKKHSIIKVIGVGGGGGNAVNHMYREGIHDVSFVLCNTDAQALNDSPVPVKLQLGTEGLGAGNRPARAREAAEETIDAVRNMLSDGTKMTFITAGMGGGTGTGAAPVIARESKAQGILTVGIVTIPFQFEGKRKIDQALNGVEEIANNVDALLVINNQRLLQIYPDLPIMQAFGKADDTLSIAAKSIAEIITEHGIINLDFNDVKTVLKDGGVAIMSTGYGEGEGRVKNAIRDALDSPLLNNKDIYNSKKILLAIYSSAEKNAQGLMMDEMNDVNDFMDGFSDEIETNGDCSATLNLATRSRSQSLPQASESPLSTGSPSVSRSRTKKRLSPKLPGLRLKRRGMSAAASTMATLTTSSCAVLPMSISSTPRTWTTTQSSTPWRTLLPQSAHASSSMTSSASRQAHRTASTCQAVTMGRTR